MALSMQKFPSWMQISLSFFLLKCSLLLESPVVFISYQYIPSLHKRLQEIKYKTYKVSFHRVFFFAEQRNKWNYVRCLFRSIAFCMSKMPRERWWKLKFVPRVQMCLVPVTASSCGKTMQVKHIPWHIPMFSMEFRLAKCLEKENKRNKGDLSWLFWFLDYSPNMWLLAERWTHGGLMLRDMNVVVHFWFHFLNSCQNL